MQMYFIAAQTGADGIISLFEGDAGRKLLAYSPILAGSDMMYGELGPVIPFLSMRMYQNPMLKNYVLRLVSLTHISHYSITQNYS